METETFIKADKLNEALVLGTLAYLGRPVHEAEKWTFMNWALAYRSRPVTARALQRIYDDEIVPYYGIDDWRFGQKPKTLETVSELS